VRVLILDLDHRFSDQQQVHRYPRVSLAVMSSLDGGLVGSVVVSDAFSHRFSVPLCIHIDSDSLTEFTAYAINRTVEFGLPGRIS
jgi:hypothetical protein